jgi:hypothetical protein
VALLRSAQRFELTHNYRAHLDPPFARCLAELCNPPSGASVTAFLGKLRRFDPCEELRSPRGSRGYSNTTRG